ncbi:increased DNA methylation 1-like [Apium graveolens]|uniref:increased DNA methylation 1-like n=1 Tax=Apium graveolens TaxID=4045 RepID=UPI003D796B4F
MVVRSKKTNHLPSSSSGISCTSNDTGNGFVANEKQVNVAPVRPRRGRPPKSRGNENERMKTILSWIINCNIVQEYAEVCYVHNDADQQPLKVGKIMREGILCNCCIKVLTAENFQYHAVGKVNSPYERIIVMDMNQSLLHCMTKAWNHPSEVERHKFNMIVGVGSYSDTYDDACMICADGGELMCCDRQNCNSTHHYRCMDMKDVPASDWFCPYCACKLCGNPPREEELAETCLQCEKKYHRECHPDRELDINRIPIIPFCEQGCKEIYEKLEEMVGASNKLDGGYTWTLLRRMENGDSAAGNGNINIRTECHSKLAIAWSLMKECFEPITDRHTRIDVIQSIVYNIGSNYTRINFRGFYTAVLEKDGEIICAASLRIHGTKLAEMPFIATNPIHRRKGMCRKLMSAIESALCFLKVEHLIIPSVRQKERAWTKGFNFTRLDDEVKKQIMCYNTMMFHDSIRLQKVMLPPDNGQVAREAVINAGNQSRNVGIDLNQQMDLNRDSIDLNQEVIHNME